MKIYQGASRTAYVFDKFTVKAARLPLKKFAARSFREIGLFVSKRGIYAEDKFGVKSLCKNLYFKLGPTREGITSNLLEAGASKIMRGKVVPTALSFGVFNVMRTVPVPIESFTPEEKGLIYDALAPFAIQTGRYTDWHTFHNSRNYGLHGGVLKLLDYGSRDAVKTLMVSAEIQGKNIRGIDALAQTMAAIQRARNL